MTTLTVTRTSFRTHGASIAAWLAVGLAVAIPLSNSLTTLITVLLALVCLLQMDRATWATVLKHPITLPILALVALSLIDISYTIANKKEVILALRKNTRLLYFPLLLPIFMQSKWRQWSCLGFLATILFSVIVAMYDGWTVFKDTIFTSLFVAFSIFMLAHISVDHKQYRNITIPVAAFFTFYLFSICTGRTGQFLFLLLFGLFIWQRLRVTKKHLAIATLVLCTGISLCLLVPSSFLLRQRLAVEELQQYAQSGGENIPHSSSTGTRLVLAKSTWELIKMKPIFGWGTGSFPAAYAKYAPEAQIKDVTRTNPHNQYLLNWTELGLPGLFSLIWLFASSAWFFMRAKNLEGYLGTGLILAVAVGCVANSWLLDCTSAFFFVFFAAVFAGAQKSV